MYKPPREFRPHPLIASGHAQTIITHFVPKGPCPPISNRHNVPLLDGDQLVITESRPANWNPSSRIILMAHGLAGCEDSSYMIRIGRKLYNSGYNVIRMNHRGCGPGAGLARHPYHCGRSEDTLQILHFLGKLYPKAPITQVGFSLSANITLKMAGELARDGESTDHRLQVDASGKKLFRQGASGLDSCIAVSPPIDLSLSAKKMAQSSLKIFDQYFIRRLKKHVRTVQLNYPDTQEFNFPSRMTLRAFDNLFTAPRSGFKDSYEYYSQCSSRNFLPDIKIPTLVLLSEDDPVVETAAIDKLQLPASVTSILTEKGGHVGFLEGPRFWLDDTILDWLQTRP
jgi:predicted alpha/beta-fold hydrolase